MSESAASSPQDRKRGRRGLGSAYYDEDRGRWVKQASYIDPITGKRKRPTFYGDTLEEALEKERAALKASNDSKARGSASGTVGAWLEEWVEEHASTRVRPTTLETYRRHLLQMAKPKIGHIKMKKLEVAHIRKLRDDLVREHPDGMTRNSRMTLTILSNCLNDAVIEGKIPRNVADGKLVKRPPDNKKPGVAPDADQAKQILRAALQAEDRFTTRWAAALMIGPRQGECLGLQWDRVDTANREIELSWQLQSLRTVHGCGSPTGAMHGENKKKPKYPCGEWFEYRCPQRKLKDLPHGFESIHVQNSLYLTRPKTARSRRRLPIPPELAKMLEIHREMTRGEPNPHNLVWHEPDGSAITITADTRRWKEACARAGLPHFKLHSARHATATLLKSMGVDQRIIMHLLGHTSEDTTSIYAEITDDVSRKAIEQMGSLLQLD